MFHYIGILLLITPTFHTSPVKPLKPQKVQLFTKTNHRDPSILVDVNRCTSLTKYSVLSNGVHSINTFDGCVNLYDKPDCTGDYELVKPGTDWHNHLERLDRYYSNIKSVGPCHEICHPNTIESLSENETHVALKVYKRAAETPIKIVLERNQCVEIPEKMNNQIDLIGTNTSACIEVYDNSNCRGFSETFTITQKKSPYSLTKFWYEYSHSISLCGFNCHRNRVPTVSPDSSPDGVTPEIGETTEKELFLPTEQTSFSNEDEKDFSSDELKTTTDTSFVSFDE